MAETLTANINDQVDWKHQGEVGLLTANFKGNLNRTQSYTDGNGTTAGQINEIFQDERTLAASANETLDLSGSLVGAFRSTVDFTKIKEFIIELPDITGQAGNITIGGATTHPWPGFFGDAASDKIKLPKGGRIHVSVPTVAGLAVAAGSTDKLFIENLDSGNNATYKIVLLGVHA